MKDLIERLKVFNRKATDGDVLLLVTELGETTSIPVLEEALKHYKEEEKRIRTGDLLEWMRENDLEVLETEDVKIDISTYVSAKVSDEEIAFRWLEENQYGELIKDTLSLGKGEFTADVREALESLGVSYEKKSGIHPQSLKKIISDRLKAGEDIPSSEEGIEIAFYDECRFKEKG